MEEMEDEIHLEDLPSGLLILIFEFTQTDTTSRSRDLSSLRLVNKHINSLVTLAVKEIWPKTCESLVRFKRFQSATTINLSAVEPTQWRQDILSSLNKDTVHSLTLGRHNTLTLSAASAIGALSHLVHLEFQEANIGDTALTEFKPLSRLTSLCLRDCNNVTDTGLSATLPHLQSLQEVDLGGCWRISDATLQALAPLPLLRKIDLTACERFTTTGITALSQSSQSLRTLLMPACWQITDETLSVIATVGNLATNLECLGLFESGEQVTDTGLLVLTALTNLTALDLGYSCWSHTSAGLSKLITHLKQLKMLNIGGCEGATNEVLYAVGKLHQLTMLDCSECQRISAKGIQHLAALPHLADLNLGWNLRLDDAALWSLVCSGGGCALTRLDLSFCAALTDDALAAIAGCTFSTTSRSSTSSSSMRYGVVGNRSSSAPTTAASKTDGGVGGGGGFVPSTSPTSVLLYPFGSSPPSSASSSSFPSRGSPNNNSSLAVNKNNNQPGSGGLSSLQVLILRKCGRLTNKGMAYLSHLPSLHHLDLSYSGPGVTAQGLKHLATLPDLQQLTLASCHSAATVMGLSALHEAVGLTCLDVSDNKRFDDGCMQAVSLVRNLQSLSLRGCVRITDHGIAALARTSRLESVQVDGCHRLSQKGVDALCGKLPRLRRVVLPGGEV